MRRLIILPLLLWVLNSSAQLQLDIAFNEVLGTGFNGVTKNIIIQSDGKIIVSGDFNEVIGETYHNIVRLNTDGSIDENFDAGTFFETAIINDLLLDENTGKIYVAGNFAEGVVRLNTDGTIDGAFNFDDTGYDGPINALAIDTSGKIIAGQGIGTSNIAARIARFNSDGSLDDDFNAANFTGFFSSDKGLATGTRINHISIDGNGKILVAGSFTSFGTVAEGIIRLNDDGSKDTGFNLNYLNIQASERFYTTTQDDGKVLVAGLRENGTIAERFNTDGSRDNSFAFNSAALTGKRATYKIHSDATDDILIAGMYGLLSKKYNNGLDSTITAGVSFLLPDDQDIPTIYDFVVTDEGDIIAVGEFNFYNGFVTNSIAKLKNCTTIDIAEDLVEITSGCYSEDTELNIQATGSNLNYQWQVKTTSAHAATFSDLNDDATYSGSQSSTLTINDIQSGINNYYYRCIITSDDCITTSKTTLHKVYAEQNISSQPQDEVVCEGDAVTFELSVNGSIQDIQWQVDSLSGSGYQDILSNGNSTGLTINNVPLTSNGYMYRAILSSCTQPIASDEVELTVYPKAELISWSGNTGVCLSGEASFTVEAVGEGTLQYQWQYYLGGNSYADLSNGVHYSGVNTATLQVIDADEDLPEIDESGPSESTVRFRCKITNSFGCDTFSPLRTLYITQNTPSILQHPQDISRCLTTSEASRNGNFSVSANNAYTYQWQVDTGNGEFVAMEEGSFFSDVKSSSLKFTGITDSVSGFKFRCVVGPCEVISNEATLLADEFTNVSHVLEEGEPINIRVCDNTEVAFTVNSEIENVGYQWLINDQEIQASDERFSGADSPTLTILNATVSLDNNNFRCSVSSANEICNDRLSSNRRLNVQQNVSFSTPPSSVYPVVCEKANINIVRQISNYNPNLHTIQWQVKTKEDSEFTDIEADEVYINPFDNSLTIAGAFAEMDSNEYRVVVRGCSVDFVSDTSMLTVREIPKITSQPETLSICVGDEGPRTFTVEAEGNSLNYFWQYSDQADGNYSDLGQGSDTLYLSNFYNENQLVNISGYYFRCIVINDAPCNQADTSAVAQLFAYKTDITSYGAQHNGTGQNYACEDGSSFMFVAANGENISYQWQVDQGEGFEDLLDNENYSGTNTDSLIFNALDVSIEDYNYRCKLSSNCDDLYSPLMNVRFDYILDTEILSFRNDQGQLELTINQNYNVIWYDETGQEVSRSKPFIITQPGIYTAGVYSSLGVCFKATDAFEVTETILGSAERISFRLYPNPVKQFMEIKFDQNSAAKEIKIYNQQGKLLMNTYCEQTEIQLNLSHLETGIYTVIVHDDQNRILRKIVKL